MRNVHDELNEVMKTIPKGTSTEDLIGMLAGVGIKLLGARLERIIELLENQAELERLE